MVRLLAFLQTHGLILLLSLAAAATVCWLWLQRERLRLRILWVIVLSVLHVAVGVGCVKAFAILEAGSLSVAGNMSLFGAVFLLPLFYWIGAQLTKRDVKAVFDVFTIPMVFTLACARVNCLLSGCCLGRQIPGSSMRYPTREAELLYYALLLLWLVYQTGKHRTDGRLYPVYMASYGLFRFVTEFFRASASGTFLHLSHLWAALCFLTGLSILLESQRKTRRSKNVCESNHRRKHT